MFNSLQRLLAMAAVATLLVGCEGTSSTKEDDSESASVTDNSTTSGSGASTAGLGSGSSFQGHALDDPASALSKRTVYFEYDSAIVTDADRPVVEAHAHYLAANAGATVTLEGHADERGSREYNIGLGERRAVGVRQLMSLLGASGSQIRTVSYGEERPAVDGHSESIWNANRRVEIIYRTR